MGRSSTVAAQVVLKHFRRVARHPWIGSKLVKLELEKRLLHLLKPGLNGCAAGRLRQVSFRITDLCNLRCRTCGQWGESGFLRGQDLRSLRQREVAPRRYQYILQDLVAHGHKPLVYFWGGEPMLYEGILDLMEAATELGLAVSVATNGTRISSAAPRLVGAPLFLVQLSIDGHCAELHNGLRPAAGSGDNFRDIRDALDALDDERRARNTDLPLIASLTVVSRGNFRHLVDLYEAFRYRVDLFVFYLSWWMDPESASCHEEEFFSRFGFIPRTHRGWIGGWRPDDFQLLDSQLKELLARSRPWNAPPVTLIPPITGAHDLRTYYTDHNARFGFDRCVSIFQVTEVDSNGDVSPCRDYHDYVVGNVQSDTLTELWNSEPYRRFRRSLATEGLMPVCSRCCGLMGY